MNIIKFDYVTQNKIWGKEDWIISAHGNGMSIIKNGQYKGLTLKDFFVENKELLGVDSHEMQFPLLIKIIDANDDLSVQVHPGDEYAKRVENSLGKCECWYILSENDSDIIIGQNANDEDELKTAINDKKIMDKLNILPIKKGDFFYIPAGCVHAIRKNTKLLEIQQSSDITYRLYDYDRKDDTGNFRELHVEKALKVIDYNFVNSNNIKVDFENENVKIEILTDNEHFSVKKITIYNEFEIGGGDKYMLGVSLSDDIQIGNEKFRKYEGFMILKGMKEKIIGNGEIIITTSK